MWITIFQFNALVDEIGLVESSYFYGYAGTQIMAGVLANRLSPLKIMVFAVLATSLLHLTLPVAIHSLPTEFVMSIRTLQGVAEGFIFPSINGRI